VVVVPSKQGNLETYCLLGRASRWLEYTWFDLTEGKLHFTRLFLVLGNIALGFWVMLACIAILFYNPVFGWLYLIFMVIMIYGILRRYGCKCCSRCKPCTDGFGKLAGAFFARGPIKRAIIEERIDAVILIYFLLFPLPLLTVSMSIALSCTPLAVFVLASLLALSIYSLSTWRKFNGKK
jgi:hypothetical protein